MQRPTTKVLPPMMHPKVRAMASAIAISVAAASTNLVILTDRLIAAAYPPAVLIGVTFALVAFTWLDGGDAIRANVSSRPTSIYALIIAALTVYTWWTLVIALSCAAISGLVALVMISTKTRIVALITVLTLASVRRLLATLSVD